MTRDLAHVTLQTGHSRISPRSEVQEGVVESLEPLLARALAGEHVGIPEVPGYTWVATEYGHCCLLTLWAQHTEGGRPDPVPVLTVGVAGHSRCGAETWRALHTGTSAGPYATDPERQPPTPWVADRLEVGMARYPETASWSGDWSRTIAWCFLEMRKGGTHADDD